MMRKIAVLLFLTLPVFLGGCLTGSNEEPDINSGELVALKPNSALAKENFRVLVKYLEEKKPEIADLVLVSAQTQYVSGRNVILVCSYKDRGKDFYLKAFLVTDDNDSPRVTKILLSYEYDIRKE